MEDAWMGKAVERIFLPLMRLTLPEIVDINLPVEGVFHNLMIVSVKKSYAGQARKVMNGIWSMGQAMFTKCVIVVDEDCDVQDLAEVTLRVANNIDPERDIQFTLGPVDSLDHSSRLPNYGSKMGIDATRKWAAEGFNAPVAPDDRNGRRNKSRVDEIWKKLGTKNSALVWRRVSWYFIVVYWKHVHRAQHRRNQQRDEHHFQGNVRSTEVENYPDGPVRRVEQFCRSVLAACMYCSVTKTDRKNVWRVSLRGSLSFELHLH